MSKVIRKIPILNSVLDTKILEEFEAINEHDDFYQAMIHNDQELSTESHVGDVKNSTAKNILVPKNLQKIFPPDSKIQEISVQNISESKKLFKITLSDESTRYIQASKENGIYSIIEK
jgi:hypothetical protein